MEDQTGPTNRRFRRPWHENDIFTFRDVGPSLLHLTGGHSPTETPHADDDQHRAEVAGCEGDEVIRTSALNRLARTPRESRPILNVAGQKIASLVNQIGELNRSLESDRKE